MFQYAFPLRKTEPKIVTTTTTTDYRLQTDIGRTWIFKALLHNSPFGAIKSGFGRMKMLCPFSKRSRYGRSKKNIQKILWRRKVSANFFHF